MFIFKWLLKLSLYYWIFFIVAVIFDFCPSNTLIGKLIKQGQIKINNNMHKNNNTANANSNNQSNTENNMQENLNALINMIQQLNYQQTPAAPSKTTDNNSKTTTEQNSSDTNLDKLINDAITK